MMHLTPASLGPSLGYHGYYHRPFDHLVFYRSKYLVVIMVIFSSILCLTSCHFSTPDPVLNSIISQQFKYNSTVTVLDIKGNPVHEVAHDSFTHLSRLKALTLSDVKKLHFFPNLTGTKQLEHLRIDRGDISSIPNSLCQWTPKLKSLIVKSSKVTAIPNFDECTELRLIDLSYNGITSIGDESVHFFSHQSNLIDLVLSHNSISTVTAKAFQGLNSLQVLDLERNVITYIHPEAFTPLIGLRDLNLAGNSFHILPTLGLQNLRQIKTYDNPNLKDFPGPDFFPKIRTLALSYSYHCCQYQSILRINGPHADDTEAKSKVQEMILWLEGDDIDLASWTSNESLWNQPNLTSKFDDYSTRLWRTWSKDYSLPENLPNYAEEYFEEAKTTTTTATDSYTVQCLPLPSPFMPCEDLFGWWTLRCGIWIVFLLALLGNAVVVTVLLFGRSKIDVPRFLVANLAFADFFMGLYLGSLAIVDASTLGEFKKYAVSWQTSSLCQLTGFFGVLSSELSVFTLAVITLERNYAITNAMHLNKRLSLKHASVIMAFGWIFAVVMALLPFFGISDYRKFAVCLPFEIEDTKWSLIYVVCLIVINGLAFLILMGCYLRMYCAIKGSQTWNSNDSRIAKRMALLVFTDFLCWAPIAFFSLTAISGWSLVSLDEAKIFTIFVLPLNSCCNPFLYAIFTKQFKKDCAILCKRFEESRVTRGIGMGRNSSNFSNRQTPVNTNSAADKRSNNTISGTDVVVNQVCRCGLRGDTTISLELKLPDSSASTSSVVKEKKKFALSSKWLWLQRKSRKDSLKSVSIKSSNLTSTGSSLPNFVTSSISSENCPSSPTESLQAGGRIPMRAINSSIPMKAHSSLRRSSWATNRKLSHDSTLTNSTFRTTSTTTRSSVSSSSSGSKATDTTTIRSGYSSHKPLDGVNSFSSTDTDLTYHRNRGKSSAGTSRSTSHDQTHLDLNHGSIICKNCSYRREVPLGKSPTGHMVTSVGNSRRDLEDRVNYFFKKLAEVTHDDDDADGEYEHLSTSKDDSNIGLSTSSQVTSSSKTTDDTFLGELNDGTSFDQRKDTPAIVVPSGNECDDDGHYNNHHQLAESDGDGVDQGIETCNECIDELFLSVDRDCDRDSSRSPSTLSIRTQVPARRMSPDVPESSSLLNVESDLTEGCGVSASSSSIDGGGKSLKLHDRSQSMLTIESSIKQLDRKVSSDDSIKRHKHSSKVKLINLPSSIINSITSHSVNLLRSSVKSSSSSNTTNSSKFKSNSNPSVAHSKTDPGTVPLLMDEGKSENENENATDDQLNQGDN